MNVLRRAAFFGALLLLFPLSPISGPAMAGPETPVRGQTLYVAAYSHIYAGDRDHPFYLTVTLSIRNISPSADITLHEVAYHDSSGKPVRRYLEEPLVLGPLSSTRMIIRESDTSGGSGASFRVRWTALKPVLPPLVESVMIGTKTQQGISFTSRAVVIEETP